MYVHQLDVNIQKKIKKSLYEAITNLGIYSNEEVEYHVQCGLDSKISDLTDTIDVQSLLN